MIDLTTVIQALPAIVIGAMSGAMGMLMAYGAGRLGDATGDTRFNRVKGGLLTVVGAVIGGFFGFQGVPVTPDAVIATYGLITIFGVGLPVIIDHLATIIVGGLKPISTSSLGFGMAMPRDRRAFATKRAAIA